MMTYLYKKIQFLLFALLLSFAALAQINCTEEYHNQQLTGDVYDPYFNDYNGSPFFLNTTFIGSVKLSSGEIYKDLKLSYDLYKDDFVYFNEALHGWILIDKDIITEVSLVDDKNRHYKIIRDPLKQATGNDQFYFELFTGKVTLLMRKEVHINPALDNSLTDNKMGSFFEKTNYYFIYNNEIFMVPATKKKLIAYFPELKKDIKKYMAVNKIHLKDKDHLKALFEKISSLL